LLRKVVGISLNGVSEFLDAPKNRRFVGTVAGLIAAVPSDVVIEGAGNVALKQNCTYATALRNKGWPMLKGAINAVPYRVGTKLGPLALLPLVLSPNASLESNIVWTQAVTFCTLMMGLNHADTQKANVQLGRPTNWTPISLADYWRGLMAAYVRNGTMYLFLGGSMALVSKIGNQSSTGHFQKSSIVMGSSFVGGFMSAFPQQMKFYQIEKKCTFYGAMQGVGRSVVSNPRANLVFASARGVAAAFAGGSIYGCTEASDYFLK